MCRSVLFLLVIWLIALLNQSIRLLFLLFEEAWRESLAYGGRVQAIDINALPSDDRSRAHNIMA